MTISDTIRWSPRRWWYTLGVVFLIQIGLLFYFGEHGRSAISPAPFRTRLQLAADPWSEKQLSESPDVPDPSQFALPHPRGFSGAAWFRFRPMDYQPEDWSEPPRWLSVDTNQLGQGFAKFVNQSGPVTMLIADKPLPALVGIEPSLPPQSIPNRTEIRLEGNLSRRKLVAPLDFPSWEGTDLLTNSVLQLIVDAVGEVQSATLIGSCGLPKADNFALKLATSATFGPLTKVNGEKSEPLTLGRMVVNWHTIPISVTSAVPILP